MKLSPIHWRANKEESYILNHIHVIANSFISNDNLFKLCIKVYPLYILITIFKIFLNSHLNRHINTWVPTSFVTEEFHSGQLC